MSVESLLQQQDPNKKYLFRFDKQNGGFDGIFYPQLLLANYEVIKETDKSYIISYGGGKKVVSKTSRKRFAYPTVDQALQNCLHRTILAIKFQTLALERQEGYLKIIKSQLGIN